MYKKWTFFILLLLTANCLPAQLVKQGIQGNVYQRSGNRMPLKGRIMGKGLPVSTDVYFFEPTKLTQVKGQNGKLLQQVSTKLVKKVQTDKAGFYKVCLPAGQYTVLVEYQTFYYIPYFSGNEYLSLVQVNEGKMTALEIIMEELVSY